MNASAYDTIVIGSGAGGLSAAVILAKAGHKVLVCEQHEVPGGWMHSFTLEGFRFNTGVHYIGELGPGERFHQFYGHLGILEEVEFLEMNPSGYDHILIGDFRFDIPKGQKAYEEKLIATFPQEANGIRKIFQKITVINHALRHIVDEEYISVLRFPEVVPWLFRTGKDLIESFVRDPLLRAILFSQSGNHGSPPGEVSAIIHAAIMGHYFEGGYHPRGGGMAMARAFVRVLKKHHGEIRLNAPVTQILIHHGQAVGVQLENGESIHARYVISNVDPYITLMHLLGPGQLPASWVRKLQRLQYSTSCFSLYLVVNADLDSLGVDSGNYWIYETPDIDLYYRRGQTDYYIHHPPEAFFVTFTTRKDPGKMHHGHHQVEIFTFAAYDAFLRWENQPSGSRDEEYQQLKKSITQHMLQAAEHRFPGLTREIILCELGTPLSNGHYIRNHKGNMYGIAKTIKQSGLMGFRPNTPIQHLFLCGSSTMAHGVAYAGLTGVTAAARILKTRAGKLWKQPV